MRGVVVTAGEAAEHPELGRDRPRRLVGAQVVGRLHRDLGARAGELEGRAELTGDTQQDVRTDCAVVTPPPPPSPWMHANGEHTLACSFHTNGHERAPSR